MYKDLIVLLDESTSIKVNDNVTSSPFHDIALFLDREQQHSGVTVAFTYAFISREVILTHKKLKQTDLEMQTLIASVYQSRWQSITRMLNPGKEAHQR